MWSNRAWILVFLIITTLDSSVSPARAWVAREMAVFLETSGGHQLISVFQSLGKSLKTGAKTTARVSGDVQTMGIENFFILVESWFNEALTSDAFLTMIKLVIMLMFLQGGFWVGRYVRSILGTIISTKIEIYLQNHYVDCISEERSIERDSTHLLYGANLASQCITILYSAPYYIFVRIIAIILWQASLSKEWLPIMLLGILLSFIFVIYSSFYMRRVGKELLDARQGVMGAVYDENKKKRYSKQGDIYKWEVKKSLFSTFISILQGWIMWMAIFAITGLMYVFESSLLPTSFRLTDLAVAYVNIKLLGRPLAITGSSILRWQSAYPALLNTVKQNIK